MPTETRNAQPSELAQIVESIFETMLGLSTDASGPACLGGENRLTAIVQLAGDWNGAVVMECEQNLACRLAGRFLSIDPPDAVNDVVRDVLGELANMIGGNLKCALPGEIRISMPSVVDGGAYSLRLCGATVQERLTILCDEGPVWITTHLTQ